MRRTLVILGLVAAGLLAVLVGRTLMFVSPELTPLPESSFEADEAAAAAHLAEAIRFPTVSYSDPERFDASAFQGLHEWLALTYPAAHARLEREVVGGASLLYTWSGRDPSLAPSC